MADIGLLLRAARRLRARAKLSKTAAARLPMLLFMSDPRRTPRPEEVAERLPRGSGVAFRDFGSRSAVKNGLRLKAVARRRGLVLLVGADAVLARTLGADGLHLPERLAHRAGAIRRGRPDWIVTAAAHSRAAIARARRAGAMAVVVSPVFPSRSPSAGRPLTPVRFAALVRDAGIPVYALGGIDTKNAPRLLGSGAAGLAGIDVFRT